MKIDRISTWANVAASLAAALALLWNVYIFKDAVDREERTTAMTLYGEFLKMAIDNPKFTFEKQDILKLSPKEGMKYTIFAASALNVSEQIYLSAGRDPSWRKVAESIIANHHEFVVTNFVCSDFNPKFGGFLAEKVEGFKCK